MRERHNKTLVAEGSSAVAHNRQYIVATPQTLSAVCVLLEHEVHVHGARVVQIAWYVASVVSNLI